MLTLLRDKLSALPATDHLVGFSRDQAAVLLAITRSEDNPSLVLTKRSELLTTHSGEVSLPGGKWDPQDPDLRHTALRETWEEVGIVPQDVELLGALPIAHTWRGVAVAPYVGLIDENTLYTPNADELDAIFHVPLQFFLDDRRIRTDVFDRKLGNVWAPAYEYEGFEIWGFTARLVASFLNGVFGAGIGLEHSAPVKHWAAQADAS